MLIRQQEPKFEQRDFGPTDYSALLQLIALRMDYWEKVNYPSAYGVYKL